MASTRELNSSHCSKMASLLSVWQRTFYGMQVSGKHAHAAQDVQAQDVGLLLSKTGGKCSTHSQVVLLSVSHAVIIPLSLIQMSHNWDKSSADFDRRSAWDLHKNNQMEADKHGIEGGKCLIFSTCLEEVLHVGCTSQPSAAQGGISVPSRYLPYNVAEFGFSMMWQLSFHTNSFELCWRSAKPNC